MANNWTADSPSLPPIRQTLPAEIVEVIDSMSIADTTAGNHTTPFAGNANTSYASNSRSKAEEEVIAFLNWNFHKNNPRSSRPRTPHKVTSPIVDPDETEDDLDFLRGTEADPKYDLKANPKVESKVNPKAADPKAKVKPATKPKRNNIGSGPYTLLSSSPPASTSDPDVHHPDVFDPRRPATYHTFVQMMQRGQFITGTKATLVDPATGHEASRPDSIAELRQKRGYLETTTVQWARPEREMGFEAIFGKPSLLASNGDVDVDVDVGAADDDEDDAMEKARQKKKEETMQHRDAAAVEHHHHHHHHHHRLDHHDDDPTPAKRRKLHAAAAAAAAAFHPPGNPAPQPQLTTPPYAPTANTWCVRPSYSTPRLTPSTATFTPINKPTPPKGLAGSGMGGVGVGVGKEKGKGKERGGKVMGCGRVSRLPKRFEGGGM
ncbi:MAG: hypothetical protein Q9182_003749 [Xanthomendoza sp. 2 TL-2023]